MDPLQIIFGSSFGICIYQQSLNRSSAAVIQLMANIRASSRKLHVHGLAVLMLQVASNSASPCTRGRAETVTEGKESTDK